MFSLFVPFVLAFSFQPPQNINDPEKKDEAGEKSGFDLVDELTQNLVNAFQNNEVIPSYEPETMFGKLTLDMLR